MRVSITVVLLATVAFYAVASGAPAAAENELGKPQVRLTCDLLSGFGVGDSACAAGCIARNQGYKGGHCQDGVCRCRT